MNRESEGKSRGIPHLAKNERDMGHPSFVKEPGARAKTRPPQLKLVDLQDQALQIFRLGDIQDYRVVWSSSSSFQKTNTALRIAGGCGHHTVKLVPGHVVGT